MEVVGVEENLGAVKMAAIEEEGGGKLFEALRGKILHVLGIYSVT
jgi:hypothetical protein